jgi:mRNA interferase RelE/StbE
MSYDIIIENRPLRALAALPAPDRTRLEQHMDELATSPRPPGAIRLHGRWSPAQRVRVGDYRIIYDVDDAARVVRVLAVGHRSHIHD